MRALWLWPVLGTMLSGGLACSTDASGGGAAAGNSAVNSTAGNGSARPGGGNGSMQGGAGNVPTSGAATTPTGGQVGAGGTSTGNAGTTAAAGTGPAGPSVGAAQFGAGDLDAVSDGGTLTFQNIGNVGYYPSRRALGGVCDAWQSNACCMAKQQENDDKLTPWNEDLIVTLRGPMQIKQFVVYQPVAGSEQWGVVTAWGQDGATQPLGVAFNGKATPAGNFAGTVGSQCLTDVMTDKPFGCAPTSVPLCDTDPNLPKNLGWSGSKLFVIAARMPMMGGSKIDPATACEQGTANNWYNAPWIGISLGELVRENKFGPCNCYAKSPDNPNAGDGCGQFNAFEVVNDNNDAQNFDVFSTNFFGYGGYLGEGPCGKNGCKLTGVGPADLIDKGTSMPASKGGITVAGKAAHLAFRRPADGYRYFLVLFDTTSRQVQMAIIHPSKVPAAAASLLPSLPRTLDRATIDSLLAMRLPQ